ncbi:MAG: hypothetical protein DLM69_06845, partial [Candidatus Chloroheliales bacterium]
MNKLLKVSAGLWLAVILSLSVTLTFAASGSRVQDDASVFTSAQRSRLLEFANAMKVPATVLTTSSFTGSKSDFISQANSNLNSNGVLVAASTAANAHYYVVLVGRSSGLSNSDQQNAYDAGVQYLRASGGPQYAPAVFASLYSLDAALGGQASDALGVSGAPGSGFAPTNGGSGSGNTYTAPTSNFGPGGSVNNGGGFGLGGIGFGTCLCGLVLLVIVIGIFSSVRGYGNRVRQRVGRYGGYSGYGGGGGLFGGGGIPIPIPIPFGGGGGGGQSGSGGGQDFGGGGGPGNSPPNAGGGTFESPFGTSSRHSEGGSILGDIFGGGGGGG